jgi:hypothetical protein
MMMSAQSTINRKQKQCKHTNGAVGLNGCDGNVVLLLLMLVLLLLLLLLFLLLLLLLLMLLLLLLLLLMLLLMLLLLLRSFFHSAHNHSRTPVPRPNAAQLSTRPQMGLSRDCGRLADVQ